MADMQPPPKTVQEAKQVAAEKRFYAGINLAALSAFSLGKEEPPSFFADVEFMFLRYGSWNVGWIVGIKSDNEEHYEASGIISSFDANGPIYTSRYKTYKSINWSFTGPRIDYLFSPNQQKGWMASLFLQGGYYITSYSANVDMITKKYTGGNSCLISSYNTARITLAATPTVGYKWVAEGGFTAKAGAGYGLAKPFGTQKPLENDCPNDEYAQYTSNPVAQKLQDEIDQDGSLGFVPMPRLEFSLGYTF